MHRCLLSRSGFCKHRISRKSYLHSFEPIAFTCIEPANNELLQPATNKRMRSKKVLATLLTEGQRFVHSREGGGIVPMIEKQMMKEIDWSEAFHAMTILTNSQPKPAGKRTDGLIVGPTDQRKDTVFMQKKIVSYMILTHFRPKSAQNFERYGHSRL